MTKATATGILVLWLSACTSNHSTFGAAGNAAPQAVPANPAVPAQSVQACKTLVESACSQRSDCVAFKGRKIVGGTKQAPTTDPESFLGCMPSNATCGASITCLVDGSGECYVANSECMIEGFAKCQQGQCVVR